MSLLLKEQHATLLDVVSTVEGLSHVYQIEDGRCSLDNDIDFHCPIISVLHRLKIDEQSIPSTTPYLSSPAAKQPHWDFLQKHQRYKIGIVWSTQTPVNHQDLKNTLGIETQKKNIALAHLRPLFELTDIDFFSLQLEVNEEEEKQLAEYGVMNLEKNIHTFTDTAAIISQMDLIVSIDTAVVHLAGAMNKPTINLLPYVHDWRWKEANKQSVWYPSMTLLKQKKRGEWGSVIEDLISICQLRAEQYKDDLKK